jgi:hypothetical protein
MNTELRPTTHAIERANERLGWNEATLRRMLPKVAAKGVMISQTRGKLRRYLNGQSWLHKKGNATRIHGHHIYVIQGEVLVTIYELPKEFRNAATSAAVKAKK